MQLARVIGDVVATRKDENLDRDHAARRAAADTRSSADRPAARRGRRRRRRRRRRGVFVRGKEASFPFYPVEAPVDAGIVGIVDHWDLLKA